MPSIPQSLLWISLVVLWLFVLVPMLINKRDAVRRTSDVALSTRVLNSSRTARLRRRGGPASGHRSDPDWRHSDDVDDEPDNVEDAPGRSVVMVATRDQDVEAESDYLDVDVVEDSGALPVGAVTAEDEPVVVAESDELTLEYDDASAGADSDDDGADYDDSDYDDGDAEDDADDAADDDEYEYVADSSGLEAPSDADLRIADSMSASRRRRYESSTAEAVTARKYRFRARTLTVMGVLLLASAVAAFTWSSTMWWACAAVGTVAVLYLAYLRRQTRIEERVRRRRAQRVARARLGVENTADPEFDVVPARLRRPGAAVLEIDDEDPEFEHLDYVPFARHYDLPRAAGQ
ncbi:divisome protein SepX/GlpR [Mycolicibacterium hippocampi]|uniref:Membrane protein n=1 Tax=Mycolicibacterium hippocampi TaxID=659824 RepID=A0A7I9ZW96_9MYCO|nr:gephyrin-like molybdotransferase receptor GlpR [Mycolicibacterium hippocampi]GFH04938.1 membrane protein [Mycolicibacterium hippocampi]